jgi:hypothetical protein
MIQLACVVHRTNYCARGRTVEDMGLKGWRVSEVRRYVEEGEAKPVYARGAEQRSSLGERAPSLVRKV